MNQYIKKMLLAFSALGCCFSLLFSQKETGAQTNVAKTFKNLGKGATQIDLRKPILEAYYDQVNATVKKDLSIEDFEKGYMNSDYSLDDYVNILNNGPQIKGIKAPIIRVTDDGDPILNTPITMPLPFKGMPDEFFIISDNHHHGNSYFNSSKRPSPTYTYNDRDRVYDQNHSREFRVSPDNSYYDCDDPCYTNDKITKVYWNFLNPGDIVLDTISFMSYDPFNFVQHAGMIVNTNKEYTFNGVKQGTFIETIEAYASGVRFGYLDANRIVRCGTVILRPTAASDSQIDSAINFMFSQIGKEYYIPMNNPSEFFTYKNVPGKSKTSWYCTELVFAAYYNAGVNICAEQHSDSYPGRNGQYQFVIGSQMLDSIGLSAVRFCALTNNFVSAYIVKEEFSSWTIEVYNNSGKDIFVSYTPLMHNYGALSTGDFDKYTTACIYMEAYSTREVKIKKNFNLTLEGITDLFNGKELDFLGRQEFSSSIMFYTVIDGEAYATICNALWVASVDTKGNPYTYHMQQSYFVNNDHYDKYSNNEIYKLALTSNGNYKLQVKNPNSSSLSFRTQTSTPSLVGTYNIDTWNGKAYAGNDYLWTVSANSTKIIDVTNTSDSNFVIRTSAKGSGASVNFEITRFAIDKTYNEVTISKNTNVNAFYLKLSIVSKSGSTWTIRVRNTSSSSRSMYYNQKMCNKNDAKTLSGLKHINSTAVTVSANSYKDIQISENWLATSIVVYFKYNSTSYISYADGLNNSSKTLNYYTSTK